MLVLAADRGFYKAEGIDVDVRAFTTGAEAEDVTILNMSGGADMVTALAKGDIDAFSHIQPSGWQAEEAAKGAHLLTTGKGLTWDLLVLTTRRSWLEKNRDEVKRFLMAVDKATKWAMAPENSDQVSELIAKQIKVAPAITKRILAATTYDVTVDQELKDHLNNVADFLIERKVMPRPIDWSKDFDTSLLKSIDSALVKLK